MTLRGRMSARAMVVVAAVAAVAFASCGSDESTAPSTSADTTGADTTGSDTTGAGGSTTQSQTSTTVAPGDEAIVVRDGRPTCAYRAHELIAVDDRAVELADRLGVPVDVVNAGGVLSTPADPLGLSVYRVGGTIDPVDAAGRLAVVAPELQATPNYIAAFAPGWKYAPFDTPVGPIADHVVPPAISDASASIVVLDTGFTAVAPTEVDPPAPEAEVEVQNQTPVGDVVEGAAAFHGSFIVYLLGQLVPKAVLTPLAVEPRYPSDDALVRADETLVSSVRDDATVTGALLSMLADPPDYLNLSFGSYGCSSIDTKPREKIADVPDHLTPIGLRRALEMLSNTTGPLGRIPQVFAAGGNDFHAPTDRELFFPAAWAPEFDWLHSVASDPKDGFDYSNRGPWVETQARGTRVVSVLPDGTQWGEAGWYAWSGTSFATPCALAHHTTGEDGTYVEHASNAAGPFLECGLNRQADPPTR